MSAEPRVVDADEAAGMSRQEAIRTLAAAGDRTGMLMLAGPVITDADAQALRSFRPKLDPMALAVRVALLQLGAEVRDERAAALADVAELAGLRG